MLMVFLLALFMAIAKRRDDNIVLKIASGKDVRVAEGYNMDFLNISPGAGFAVIIVTYIHGTMDDLTQAHFKTTGFIIPPFL